MSSRNVGLGPDSLVDIRGLSEDHEEIPRLFVDEHPNFDPSLSIDRREKAPGLMNRGLPVDENSPLVQKQAQKVHNSVWSRMGGLAKAVFIGGLIAGVVPGLLFYGLYGCIYPNVSADLPVVGQAATGYEPVRIDQLDPSPIMTKSRGVRPQNLATRGEVLTKVDLHEFSFRIHTTGRAKKNLELDGHLVSLESENGFFQEQCQELAILAEKSGKKAGDFEEALRGGNPLESLNLEYSRWGKTAIRSKNKPEIEEKYAEAQKSLIRMSEIREDISKTTREILTDYSSTPEFGQIIHNGVGNLPYTLSFGKKKFTDNVMDGSMMRASSSDYLGIGYRNTREDLHSNLVEWAGKGSIQLSDSDPAYVAQDYLVKLSNRPFLESGLEDSLRRGCSLEPRKGTHEVHLEHQDGIPMITSVQAVDAKNADGKVVKTYRWTEIVRIFPSVDGRACEVQTTKDVNVAETA